MSTEFVVGTSPEEAFDSLIRQLSYGLVRVGLVLPHEAGGAITEHGTEIGTVLEWRPGAELALRWNPAPWAPHHAISVRWTFESSPSGCRIRWVVEGWQGLLTGSGRDMTEWAGSALFPAILHQLAPDALGDWIADVVARRPSGRNAREMYRDPKYHWPNFLLILERIDLSASDRLLEVGCGGGAFLHRALESGCAATGVDHSPEMVQLARELNRGAVETGRLEILEADAGRLPVADGVYSCCVSTGAFGFFPDPIAALAEMYRALAPGGRLALFAGTAALRGTPAAPEPIASRVRFYEGEELSGLCRGAGFVDVLAEEPEMGSYARATGLPEEAMALFRGKSGALLVSARKPASR